MGEPRVPWPDGRDGKIIECQHGYGRWSGPNEGSVWSFDLPLSADVLYMFSRGASSRGSFTVTTSPQRSRGDNARVVVSVKNAQGVSFETVTVCNMERKPGHSGIGVFVRGRLIGRCPPIHIPGVDAYKSVGLAVRLVGGRHIDCVTSKLPSTHHSIRNAPPEISSLSSHRARHHIWICILYVVQYGDYSQCKCRRVASASGSL